MATVEQQVKAIFAQWGLFTDADIQETIEAIEGSYSDTQKEAAKTDKWGTIFKALPTYAKVTGKELDPSLYAEGDAGEDKLPENTDNKQTKTSTYIPPKMNTNVREDVEKEFIAAQNLQATTNNTSVEGYVYEKRAAKLDAQYYPKEVKIKDYSEEQWSKWEERIPQDAEGKNLANFKELKKKAQAGELFPIFFSTSPATIKGAVLKTVETGSKDKVDPEVVKTMTGLKGFLLGKTLGFIPTNVNYCKAALKLAQPTVKTGKSISKGRNTLEFRVQTLGDKVEAYASPKARFLSEIKFKKDGTPETEESKNIPTTATFQVIRYKDKKPVPGKTTTVRLKGVGQVPVYVRKSGKGFEWVSDFKSNSKSGFIGKINGAEDLQAATESYLELVASAASGDVDNVSNLGADVAGLLAVVNNAKNKANQEQAAQFAEK